MVMNDITVTNSKLGGKYVFITMCNNTVSKVKVKGKVHPRKGHERPDGE